MTTQAPIEPTAAKEPEERNTPQRTLVRDLMTTNVISVRPDTAIAELAELMWSKAIRVVPVLDAEDRLVGVVSEHDLLKTASLGDPRRPIPPLNGRWHRGGGAWHRPKTVFTMMSTPVVTVASDTSVAEAAQIMYERHLGCLPVVDTDHSGTQRMVGVIGRSELLRVFLRDDEELREEIVAGLTRLRLSDSTRVRVRVEQGVVTLSGNLPTRREARLATEFVERLEGVVSLAHRLSYDLDDRR
ncbi:CBS domain-containing protein [Pseudonocardia sp. Cha107L01]|jgi:CBS domain-containing protein|uniref:CBS domain-containing protein n=1 Tax=Pseudonocardia sp. Cha107L01 TaxID=3457576 RepID=UPI00403E7AA4